jgi:hypothetical protein
VPASGDSEEDCGEADGMEIGRGNRSSIYLFFYLVCEAIDTAATPGLLCQPLVIVKKTVEKQMECRLARETGVLSIYLQSFVGLCLLFQFLNPIHSR